MSCPAQVDEYVFSIQSSSSQKIGGFQNFSTNLSPSDTKTMLQLYSGPSLEGVNTPSSTGEGFPIGFNFEYEGEIFDRVAIAGNGYIKLGKSGTPITIIRDTTAGSIFDGSPEHRYIIAPFQAEGKLAQLDFIQQSYPQLRFGVVGSPGKRVFAIEYIHGQGAGGINLFYSIQLLEKNNQIKIMYTPWGVPQGTFFQGAVGITGKNSYASRKVKNDENTWASSIAGQSPNDLCDFTSTLVPNANPNSPFSYNWIPEPLPQFPSCPESYILTDDLYSTAIPIPNTPGNPDFNGGYFAYLNNAVSIPTNAVLHWANSSLQSGQPTTYDVYLDTDNPPVTKVAENSSNPFYDPGLLAPNTTYYLKVVPVNADGTAQGCISSFTTAAKPQPCETLNPSGQGYFKSFSFGSITFDFTKPGIDIMQHVYPPVAPYTTELKRNATYTFSGVYVPQDNNNAWNRSELWLYIDYNQDGYFDGPDEAIYAGIGGPDHVWNFEVTIPDHALLGTTTLRVNSIRGNPYEIPLGPDKPEPCGNTSSGGFLDLQVTITPASGCEDFTLAPHVNNISCYNQNNGSIDLNISGGTSPYHIDWSPDTHTSELYENLPKGTYQAGISDAKGCTLHSGLIAITQPAALSIEVNDIGNTLTAVHGGTAPYTYTWVNGSTLYNGENPPNGIYTLTVEDAQGCTETREEVAFFVTGLASKEESLHVHLYPNPVQTHLHIASATVIEQIVVRDVSGSVLHTQAMSATDVQLDVSRYTAGIYTLTIQTREGVSTKRVVVVE